MEIFNAILIPSEYWPRLAMLTMLTCASLQIFLSIELNLIRLGDPVHGIVTKTVHKTLPGGGGGPGVGGYRVTGGGWESV